MTPTNIFEQAAVKKIRFETAKGLLSVEDLYGLPVTSEKNVSLDSIDRELTRKLNENVGGYAARSFNTGSQKLQLQQELVRRVIDYRQAQSEKAATQRNINNELEMLANAKVAAKANQIAQMSPAEIEEMEKRLVAQRNAA